MDSQAVEVPMRSSTRVFLVLVSVSFLLSGCASSGSGKGDVLCDLAEVFTRSMDFQPLYAGSGDTCRKLSRTELEQAGERELFSDKECTTGVSYAGESWKTFCANNLEGTETSKKYIGNPDAWGDLDTTATGPVETRWNLNHGATLHLTTVNQTKNHERPYLKRVEYRRVDGCALGMHVYKTNPNAKGLKPLIFIHGGGWKYRGAGATVGIETAAPNLTDRGYIVFAPFYRLIGDSDGPIKCRKASGKDILADIDAAFKWVFNNGERYGMDGQTKKVSVMGQSAGGHLAAYLATYYPESVKRGILLYPAPDLGFFTAEIKPPNGLYVNGFEKSKGLLFDFFPQPGVTKPEDLDLSDPEIKRNSFPGVIQPDPGKYPPLDMIHGDSDTVVPVELTTRLCQALDPNEEPSDEAFPKGNLQRTCGAGRNLTVVKGANHVLDIRCLTGNHGNLLDRLLPDAAALCPSGSRAASRKVREALEDAYSKF